MKISRLSAIAIACVTGFCMSSCAFRNIQRAKDITYLEADVVSKTERQELNIFALKNQSTAKDVFIFVHGGSWKSGKKSLYNFLGNRLARKNVVVVVVDYPLSPAVRYPEMAQSITKAVHWVKLNIAKYGGNPERIFISGHSAGGHLAALVSIRDEYFDSLGITSPIRGTILIDAAGLDMFGYLQEENFSDDHKYLKTFTKNPIYWKEASPLYHLHENMPPMLIYRGEKTDPSIIKSHDKFIRALETYVAHPKYKVLKGKKHVRMITQFLNPRNPRYKEIIAFMKEN